MSGISICYLATEIFAWGKYGGFGRATRTIGSETAKRGLKVTAIVPRRGEQNKVENLNGITILGFDLKNVSEMIKIYKDCQADIFHSQEPSFGTYLAQKFHPDKKHIVTFRDTRNISDWLVEFRLPSLNKFQVLFNWIYEDNFLVRDAVRKADQRVVAAYLLADRAIKKYQLSSRPSFLPTPVDIPQAIHKETQPTVCYIGRWDRRKRLELMFDVVKRNPNVNFIIAGSSRDSKYDQYLRSEFLNFRNVELPGFINQFESDKLSELLSKSWIQVNTAAREGLPNSFIEGCAHKCAILSSVDPDGFSSRFGRHVDNDKFHQGLSYLLEKNRWEELGERGYSYVKNTFSTNLAIDKHMKIYQYLVENIN